MPGTPEYWKLYKAKYHRLILERKAKYREKYRIIIAEKGRDYYKRNAGARIAKTIKWEATYPERKQAHRTVQYAVKTGVLKKLPCEKCGNPKSEGHHPDYSKPLEVVWVCRLHHRELDRRVIPVAAQ